MRIVVTGALGRLGSTVTGLLVANDLDVVPTDLVAGTVSGVSVRPRDLGDSRGWLELVGGADGVVHCAAEQSTEAGAVESMLATNAGGTARLCAASLAAGIRKFVFASTIQVVASEGIPRDAESRVPYLPMDGNCPARPDNPYAFSKAAAETVVRALLPSGGVECQVLRFPWLVEPVAEGPWGRSLKPFHDQERRVVADQGFSCLSFADAGRLILACLATTLPGCRTFLPAVSAVPASDVGRYVEKYFPNVPLTKPVGEMRGLIDLSQVRADTGWEPRDIPPPPRRSPPDGVVRRILRKLR